MATATPAAPDRGTGNGGGNNSDGNDDGGASGGPSGSGPRQRHGGHPGNGGDAGGSGPSTGHRGGSKTAPEMTADPAAVAPAAAAPVPVTVTATPGIAAAATAPGNKGNPGNGDLRTRRARNASGTAGWSRPRQPRQRRWHGSFMKLFRAAEALCQEADPIAAAMDKALKELRRAMGGSSSPSSSASRAVYRARLKGEKPMPEELVGSLRSSAAESKPVAALHDRA